VEISVGSPCVTRRRNPMCVCVQRQSKTRGKCAAVYIHNRNAAQCLNRSCDVVNKVLAPGGEVLVGGGGGADLYILTAYYNVSVHITVIIRPTW